MPKDVSLVLSGSGTRYPVFIGALRRLTEAGFRFKRVCGTSGGAIVAAGLAAWYDRRDPMAAIERLEHLGRELRPQSFLDPNLFSIRYWQGLYAGKRILRELTRLLPASFSDLRIPLYVVTHDLSARCAKVWGAEDKIDLPLVVRASMSLPGVFDAVFIRGHVHVDGGIGANYPLTIFGVGEDVVGLRFRPSTSVGFAPAGFEPPVAARYRNRLELIGAAVDDMVEASSRLYMESAVKARTCMLDSLGSSFDFHLSDEDLERLIANGYDSVGRWLSEVRVVDA